LVKVVKSNSSRWVHEQFPTETGFGWQAGCGAFTVSESRASEVEAYIAAQQEHHRRVSFKDEFLGLLRKHGLDFDEEGVWE
jgi:putative transposase